ncbi:CDP-glycerol:glycerophosphate glycerophosphotransferase [Oceanobacillus sp. J11TS1]|uniref:bifunctional glycosyltransferase family 2 protein/CDP-glycerol:glycerophosphate glycerophosphotransferase n=1 Tax=Oceanobacillus sp. J11TS1 TaxID=2807191 RepID=UPI001B072FD5|nr:CDP-glycerol:glycerophosphate glycerophosphotransferase [Oceanobacillus sp. J11TS1]GIO23410.1 teichoic acid biosynthesis protein F [Oceanobacillus sp. J11TS1]
MLFSIIIPYKESNINYLKDCIISLENQHFKDFEVIFIHNNSIKLEQILIESSLNYKLINEEMDSNVSVKRNKGLLAAKGDYVLFLDADDYLHMNALIYIKKLLDMEPTQAIRMKINKTYRDRETRFNNVNQAFYQLNTIEALDNVFENLNIDLSDVHRKQLVNELFEENLLNSNFKVIAQEKILHKLPFSLKVYGFVLKRRFLLENNIYFDETIDLYGEVPFLINIYNQISFIKKTTVSLYYKLIHSDKLNYPSLSQEEVDDRKLQFCLSLKEALNHCDNEHISMQIKKKAKNYYLYKIVQDKHFFNESFEHYEVLYSTLQEILNTPSEDLKIAKRHSKEIVSIQKGNFKRAYSLSKMRLIGFNIIKFIKPKSKRYRQTILQRHIFSRLPKNNKLIIFESFHGKQYSDSPRAIYEYLKKNYPRYKLLWSADAKHLHIFQENNLPYVKRFSFKWLLLMTRAKYWVINARLPKWVEKPEDTIYLQTWHGTPLKKLGVDIGHVLMPGTTTGKYMKNFVNEASRWDYLVSPNKYSSDIFKRAFQFEHNILETGYPRNDVLINDNNPVTINSIKQRLNIPTDKKIILYAPTWRDNQFYKKGQYKFDIELDLQLLQKEFGDTHRILLRMHYLVAENLDLTEYDDFVSDVSMYEDIRELYLISDMLITDYSSVFFDYANLQRPILFFVYDLEDYRDNLRGFYLDFENEAPGPLLKTTEEIIHEIKQIEKNGFKPDQVVTDFYNRFCYLENGNASKRVVDQVFIDQQ